MCHQRVPMYTVLPDWKVTGFKYVIAEKKTYLPVFPITHRCAWFHAQNCERDARFWKLCVKGDARFFGWGRTVFDLLIASRRQKSEGQSRESRFPLPVAATLRSCRVFFTIARRWTCQKRCLCKSVQNIDLFKKTQNILCSAHSYHSAISFNASVGFSRHWKHGSMLFNYV